MNFTVLKKTLKNNSVIFQNFTYITILQVFVMLAPLITYPYLTRVLGLELYGWVITAQIVASYCSILVDFGFKSVSAKHVSIHRNDKSKLSEIVSSILSIRLLLWILALTVYATIIYLIPSYRSHYLLFIFSFGLTFNELLFPQFYFQGVERMKYIAILNIVIRSIFVVLTFVFIRSLSDYIYVPLLMSIGYFIGGILSLYVIFYKDGIEFILPSWGNMKFYLKDASSIFFTDVICTIKDKCNYLLLGAFIGMKDVVIYDLGSKFTNIILKPFSIVGTVLFPKMAKERNIRFFRKIVKYVACGIVISVLIVNIFLPYLVEFFTARELDLLPIRLYLLSPIFVGVSGYIASNLIIALGYNKYIFYSIIVTTIVYLSLLGLMYAGEYLNSIHSFVLITVLSYLGELVYRLFVAKKIVNIEEK
ncbi:oligosaccharide flippase family protein [Butyricimonas synergistica]|uniref:oligosaccharide flippase family protein n=1 Tax=Butyricimonas synergistica TaxID=544644 RepID=UPI0003625778|nr:oligosaccharide flippase family protein [Butyricimonas synergistica]